MQADRSTQRATTRLCIQCGLFLLQHGAESALVEELSTRLGLALGMDSVESSISSNAIVLTTIKASKLSGSAAGSALCDARLALPDAASA